jgi:hypothetical protein
MDAYIQFKTHGVVITRDDNKIYCFKFSGTNLKPVCDIETFPDEESATEWIVEPFPQYKWQVILEEE